jgi:hypothetical protein
MTGPGWPDPGPAGAVIRAVPGPGLVPRQQITRVRVTTTGAGQEGWEANVPATVTWRQR